MKYDKRLILNRIKIAKGIKTDAKLAKFLGITPQTLANYVIRNSVDWDNLLSKCVSINVDYLLTGEGNMLRNTPSSLPVATLSTGTDGVPLIPIEALAGIPVEDNISIRFSDCSRYVVPEFTEKGVEFLIRVSGSSMYPKFSNGDVLACRRIHDILFFQWGKVYVIDSSQGALVKRVFLDEANPDNIILVSDNKERYPPFSFPKSDIRSISIVIGVIRIEA